jgi:hypothetical protein
MVFQMINHIVFSSKIFDEFEVGEVFTNGSRDWVLHTFANKLRGAESTDGKYRAVEQNPNTGSDYANRARSGEKIIWFFDLTDKTYNQYGDDYVRLIDGDKYYNLKPVKQLIG